MPRTSGGNLPGLDDLDPPPSLDGGGFRIQHRAQGLALEFPALRAPAPALGLLGFALLCALMPALGLSALLPLQTANAAAVVALALIGGFAAPFIVASVVFAALSVYLLANSLRVEISADGVCSERRLFGRVTRRRVLARADMVGVEPRINARSQNLFSTTPRYALVATHKHDRRRDVVIAEDLAGRALMNHVRASICAVAKID